MSAESDVRDASESFYEALNAVIDGDPDGMADIWSRGDDDTAMHPIGGRDEGWDAVSETFENFATATGGGQITLDDQVVRVGGDLAYETGVEKGKFLLGGNEVTVDGRVTNVYRREADGWKIVHHHADISPDMIEAVAKLEG